jgi:S-adenosyl-L-methionine hydrolase (adenosine-forming)
MAIITLTSDWKSNDFYIGAVKGSILNSFIEAIIVDINHQVSPFNTAQAAFILKNSFEYFPTGTVHIIDVNSEPTEQASYIALEYKDHFFIGTDNGGFGLICKDEINTIVQIEKFSDILCKTFPALHVFAPAAAHLAMGKSISELGSSLSDINRQTPLRATIDEAVIVGSVIFIDSYHNIITNISKELFERVGRNRRFEILVQSNHYKINKINITYNETSSGELLAIFNAAGLLEIAINKGNIAELLNLSLNSNVRIKFFD